MADQNEQKPASSRRTYIVDDDAAFRTSLAALLESDGWKVEDFASAKEFLNQCERLEPGLLLLDLHLQRESGLGILESRLPQLDYFGVVVITGAGEIQTAVRCMKAGALDFLEKPFDAEEALERLDQLYSVFQIALEASKTQLEAKRKVEALSKRERDVLDRLISGASNKIIARSLDLSPRTVEMHRARMLQKLGVKTTTQAVEIARLAGLQPVGDDGDGL